MALLNYSPSLISTYAKRNAETLSTLNPSTRFKVENWLQAALSKGFLILIYSGYRPLSEQWELRKKYLQGGPRAARPGESYHNYRAAIDFVPITPDGKADWDSPYYKMLGELGEKYGLYSGRHFNDNPHLQDNTVGDISTLKKQYPGWEKYHAMEDEMLKTTSKPPDYKFVTYEMPFHHKRKKKKVFYIVGSILIIGTLTYVYSRKRRHIRR